MEKRFIKTLNALLGLIPLGFNIFPVFHAFYWLWEFCVWVQISQRLQGLNSSYGYACKMIEFDSPDG